jgi:5-methylthioadenosine/S-adenosylhomocysteine deaminase
MNEYEHGQRGTEGGRASDRLSRRGFLQAGAAGVATLAVAGRAFAQDEPGVTRPLRERVLLRGGTVLTLDPALGDFERADVLLEGARIAAVQPAIEVSSDAVDVIDAAGTIVMPGFVDTHRHMWQGTLRNILPDGLLGDYGRDITGAARGVFRPEDARVGDLVSALGAQNAGVTTILDWSHIGNSPAHSDAAIEGLREAGIRAVYAYGPGAQGADNRFSDDIRRLRREHFSTADQLLTLALAAGGNPRDWAVARDVGAFISIHVVGSLGGVTRDVMGADVT